jgi:glycosyltransferase involved in cell wall biosynthesis
MDISVIVPLYNESSSLRDLFAGLKTVLESLPGMYEIIFVDDGSTDDSFSVLKDLHDHDPHIEAIRLRKNSGKTAALLAGLTEATGETIVTIDGDLQDSPSEIPFLIMKLEEGYDLVSGWKFERQDPLLRRISSKIFNRTVSFFSGVRIHDFNCGLKVFRRHLIPELILYGEMHRFIPALAGWRGFRIGEMKVRHFPRRHGRSKYGPERYWRGLLDFLTVVMLLKYNHRPLHLFGGLGMVIGLAGLGINVYLSVGWIFGRWIGQRPLLILGVLLMLVGIQMVFFGLLAEMMNFLSDTGKGPLISQVLKPLGRQHD